MSTLWPRNRPLNLEKTRLLSSTATIACYYERGIFSFRSGLESSDVLAYLEVNPDMVDAVEYVHSTAQDLAYEAAKRAWIAANPGATPEQYEAAMRAIAARFGV